MANLNQHQPSVNLGTASPPYRPMADSNPNVNQYYNDTRAKCTALAQIVTGSLISSSGIASAIFWRGNKDGLILTLCGILAGLLFMSSGIVGMYAASRRKNGLIVGYMVLSIISALVAGIAAIYCTAIAINVIRIIEVFNEFARIPGIIDAYIGSFIGSAFVFFFECIFAIIASALGCSGMCCTPHDDNNQMNVI